MLDFLYDIYTFMTKSKLKSPYPFFGGKSRVAKVIWSGLGEVANYVEPFAGSLAVLLANPQIPKIETVNDKDCFISNFWRAVSQDPQGVAKFADYPVHEADLHARHKWLVSAATTQFHHQMNTDPDYYDLKIAGWWVWGMGASIGNNWLQPKGVNASPLLSSAGGGIHGLTLPVFEWFDKLRERTRRVRVCCGDWKKVITPSITYASKGLTAREMTAVFLDPPYDAVGRDEVYREEGNIFSEVCQWAVANGDNPRLRIALCGYEGNHGIPATWQEYAWEANGGLGNLGNDRGKANKARERIWFSPHCLEIK
jgi:site-specific DNA-adenine methylase